MKIVGYCGDWNLQSVTRLVALIAPSCDQFTLVAMKGREEEVLGALSKIMPYWISTQIVTAWPGTIHLGGETRSMMKFTIEPVSIRLLVDDIMPMLFSFDPPMEDLGLLRSDGRPCLVMISHEKDVYMKLEQQEFDALPHVIGVEYLRIQGDDEYPGETY